MGLFNKLHGRCVHIMKGPAYVADAYPVRHADRPADEHERDTTHPTKRSN